MCSQITLLNRVVWRVKSRGPKTDPLRDSKIKIGFGGQTVAYLNPLVSSRCNLKPVKCLPSNPELVIKSSQGNSMVNSIEGSGKGQGQCHDSAVIH